MKFGFNLLLWTGHVTREHWPILKVLKRTGYDSIEIPLFEGTPDYYGKLGEYLAELGFDVTAVSVLGAGCNSLSDDRAERQAAVDRAERERNATASRRLQAELEENARLRKALEDAQKKLDAIANIERTITERKPQPEGRTP